MPVVLFVCGLFVFTFADRSLILFVAVRLRCGRSGSRDHVIFKDRRTRAPENLHIFGGSPQSENGR